MSSLHTSILQRRVEEGAPISRGCVVTGPSQAALIINTWSAGRWVLPWSYFLGAHHHEDDQSERLVLRFAHAEVRVEGDHLASVVDDLAAQRVESLRDLPERFRAELRADEPFIRRLVVRSLTDLPAAAGPASA